MLSPANDATLSTTAGARSPRAWREIEFWLLALLVVGVYFTRLTDLTIRGEESRWARVALEMMDTGDWVVPRQQGQPFCDRPPLNSWAMIAAAQLTGGLNLAAIRLPSAVATLLTALLLYGYGRNYLSRAGALAAGAIYVTMGQVLQLGRVAESDALLTLGLSGALFTWHYAYAVRRDPRLAWLAGYALAAVAALAKGPQGPVYFVAIAAALLVWQRDWRFLFSRWHAAGMLTFVLAVGAWQMPLLLAVGPTEASQVWAEGGNVGSRFQWHDLSRTVGHWFEFPFQLLGSMLPWSLLVPALASRWFRQSLGEAKPLATFVVVVWAVALPTCWLPTEARPRYLMALYPCAALLFALLVQRSWEAQQLGWWRRSWTNILQTGAILLFAAPFAVLGARLFAGQRWQFLQQSLTPALLVCYAAAGMLAAAATLWARREAIARRAPVGILALAAFIGMSYTVVAINVQMRISNDPSSSIASIRQLLPPGEQLVSYGYVHHLFAYYYEKPIEYQALQEHVAPADSSATYFCFAIDPGFETAKIPFAWQPVAEISCDRAQSDNPRAKVVVGKRLPLTADATPPGSRPR